MKEMTMAKLKSTGRKHSLQAMDAALINQREILFQAIGIVGLAALAAKGSLNDDAWTALNAAYGLMNSVAGKLESILIRTSEREGPLFTERARLLGDDPDGGSRGVRS
jgi:hypothetical protein